MSGLLVAFEGGEGAGKSTQVAAVRAALRGEGVPVTATREPGGTGLGERLRELVLSDRHVIAPRAEALLYLADRAQHVDMVIRPALERGDVVLCDRYVDSTLAYQGAGRGLPDLEPLCAWSAGGLAPHLTVLLDVEPAVGVGRANRRGGANRFEAEQVEFHERVRAEFVSLARRDRGRYLVLNAARDPVELTAVITRAVLARRPARAVGAR